jgi:hypothetical protein
MIRRMKRGEVDSRRQFTIGTAAVLMGWIRYGMMKVRRERE